MWFVWRLLGAAKKLLPTGQCLGFCKRLSGTSERSVVGSRAHTFALHGLFACSCARWTLAGPTASFLERLALNGLSADSGFTIDAVDFAAG